MKSSEGGGERRESSRPYQKFSPAGVTADAELSWPTARVDIADFRGVLLAVEARAKREPTGPLAISNRTWIRAFAPVPPLNRMLPVTRR